MLEAYKVGVTLEMTSNVSRVLDQLMRDVEDFNRLVKEGSRALGGLRSDFKALGEAGSSVGKLSAAMEKLSSTKGLGGMVGDIDRMAGATNDAAMAAERLGTALRENARLAAEAGRSGGGGGGGGRTGGRSGGGSGHGGHDLMLTGLGAAMVGGPVVSGVQTALNRAFEVGHLRTQILADDRVSPAQADKAVDAAYAATTSAPGTRVADNLKSLIDLKNVTGSLDEAETALPKFAQLSAVLQLMDARGGGSGDPAYAAAKAMEIMGQMVQETTDPKTHRVTRTIDPALLNQHLEAMARVAVATNMRVAPRDYLGFAKQARVAGMTLSDEFIYQELPAWIQTTGGPRAGTALMSMAQVFQGGKMTKKSLAAMTNIGLAKNGKVLDLDLMRTDPLKYVESAQKRMDAAGIHGTDNQLIALLKASQRSTIAGALAELLKDAPAILKEQQNILNTKPDAFAHFADQDPQAKLQQFDAAFDKLLVTLGSASMDDAVKLLDKVTNGLNSLSQWAKDHPDTARVATEVAAGLGAVAVGLGTLSTALFLFGPALKLLGVGGGAASGGKGAVGAGAADGGSALAGVLGGVILPAAVAGTILLKPTHTQSAADDRAPYGGQSMAQRFPNLVVPPQGTSNDPIIVHVQNADQIGDRAGTAAAAGTTTGLTRAATAPKTGPTVPQVRLGPLMPGMAGGQ